MDFYKSSKDIDIEKKFKLNTIGNILDFCINNNLIITDITEEKISVLVPKNKKV